MGRVEYIFADNFAGGGGASSGIERAIGRSVDIAVNHDEAAITMHAANHPGTTHYREDIFAVDPTEATQGKPVAYAWFSPDCRHFSRAKGSSLKSSKVRGLAWVVCRWAGLVKPNVMVIENVAEFMTWGPLKKGKPIKHRAGETYEKWLKQITDLGYTYEWRILNAADYGAPTIRKRYVGVFRNDGRPITWPEATHGDRDSLEVRAGLLEPYVSAGSKLDFNLPSQSIFERERPLVENTMKRIFRGLRKYVLECDDPYIIDDQAHYLTHYYGTQGDETRGSSLGDPITTIPTNNRFGLVTAFLSQHYTTDSGQNLKDPHPTIMTSNKSQLVTAFLLKYYGSESGGHSLHEPLGTITTRDRFGLVTVEGIDYQIVDIRLRMLTARELARCQGFSDDYILDCVTETEAKAKIGNSVCPDMAEAVTRSLLPEFCESREKRSA